MESSTSRWLASHTWSSLDWAVDQVTADARSAGLSIAVVLPARNEAATIGAIVRTIRADLVDAHGLVGEVVVVDSGSSDTTAEVATAAGARVVRRETVLPEVPVHPGKGEAMWRGLAATTADIVVYIDADLQSFTSDYVVGLVGPLIAHPELHLTKAIYERPLVAGETVVPAGGGRVTELVARPLINRLWPALAGVVQPLAGEYAGRRALLEALPFPCGYGVELALLVDTYARLGLDAIGQVDLGVRVHRHHDDAGLGLMAAEILETALQRMPTVEAVSRSGELVQFDRTDDGYQPRIRSISAIERPPLARVRP